MVKLQAIRAGNSKLVNSQSLVAVVVGGTSGIGEFTLRALVSSHLAKGNGLCIYIVGRNAEAAKKIISDCTANVRRANIVLSKQWICLFCRMSTK